MLLFFMRRKKVVLLLIWGKTQSFVNSHKNNMTQFWASFRGRCCPSVGHEVFCFFSLCSFCDTDVTAWMWLAVSDIWKKTAGSVKRFHHVLFFSYKAKEKVKTAGWQSRPTSCLVCTLRAFWTCSRSNVDQNMQFRCWTKEMGSC